MRSGIGVVLTQVKEEKHVPWWSISVRIHCTLLLGWFMMIPFLADERITPERVHHDSWVCSDVVGVVSRYKGYLGLFTELPAKAGMGSTLIHCWQLPNGQGCHMLPCCHRQIPGRLAQHLIAARSVHTESQLVYAGILQFEWCAVMSVTVVLLLYSDK